MFSLMKTAVRMAAITAERHPETAQKMIVNPLSVGGLRGLFSTQAPTEERVAALLAMAQAGGRGGR